MRNENDKQIGSYGSYGSGLGTYAMMMVAAAIVVLVLRACGM